MNFKKKTLVKRARKKLGLTIRQFAKKLGVSKSALHNYETGKREPPWHVLLACCKILGIKMMFRRYDDGVNPKSLVPIGQKISLLRRIKFITVKGLSYLSGIPSWKLYAIEKGEVYPNREETKKIADALKIPVNLFRDKNFLRKIQEIKRRWWYVVG